MKVRFDGKLEKLILETETNQDKKEIENAFHFHGGAQPWGQVEDDYESEQNDAFGLDIGRKGYDDPKKQWVVRIGIRKADWNYE